MFCPGVNTGISTTLSVSVFDTAEPWLPAKSVVDTLISYGVFPSSPVNVNSPVLLWPTDSKYDAPSFLM